MDKNEFTCQYYKLSVDGRGVQTDLFRVVSWKKPPAPSSKYLNGNGEWVRDRELMRY